MCSVLIVSNNKNMPYIESLLSADYYVTVLTHKELGQAGSADITIIDLQHLNELDWLESWVRAVHANTLLLVIAEPRHLSLININDVISLYAWDYHTTPVVIDRLLVTMGRMRGILHMRKPWLNRRLRQISSSHQPVICSVAMQKLQCQILKVAPTNIPVLVTGPSGAGKELVARKIHQHSERAKGAWVVVNCGAIATGLSSSELFGHEKGAFTGAIHRHVGKLAQADGGTLFLDEIGDLPMDQQTHLLRFLQEGCFDVVGGKSCRADVRVVSATHVDLLKAIDEGHFRLDLFYRLNGVNLEVPSLSDRIEDLPELAHNLLLEAATSVGGPVKPLSDEAMTAILKYAWPGNVRELINRLRRALVMSEGMEIGPKDLDLPLEISVSSHPLSRSLRHHKEQAERLALSQALEQTGGQVNLAAKNLKVSRATLYRLLEKHDLLT
ncbi:MAG: sigma-54-dependent transcriptional regulator [Shewanella sp.]